MSERAGPTAEPVPPQPDDDDGFEKVNAEDVKEAAAGDKEGDDGGGNSLFSLRKPRDAKAGAASAAKSVIKGVLGGMVSLVAAPVIGAREQGAKGFVKGLGAGVVSAVALPVAGVVVGGVQLARGMANTPNAINEERKGRFWDEQKRQWVDYDPNLSVQIEMPNGGSGGGGGGGGGGSIGSGSIGGGKSKDGGPDVKDSTLYDLLEVKPDATDSQIKKAYYKLARELHPDKNPDDPNANDRFQQLSQAYQVLSNPTTREQYNLRGEEGVSSDNIMESSMFFTMLFGSDKFEHLIGELYMTSSIRLAGKEMDIERSQIERVATLAKQLQDRLLVWELGNHRKFAEIARAEAIKLRSASYGDTILRAVGRAYENSAQTEGLGGLTGIGASFRSFGQSVGRYAAAASAVTSVAIVQKKVEAQQERKRKEALKKSDEGAASDVPTAAAADGVDTESTTAADQDAADLENMALPALLKAMWSGNAIDIANTLKKSCKAVLRGGNGIDPIPKDTRIVRAHGLLELGKIFKEIADTVPEGGAAAPDSPGKMDFNTARDRVQGAAMAAHMKEHMEVDVVSGAPPVGSRVVLHSIVAKPELNGMTGIIESHIANKGRCGVKLGDGSVISLKPANLRPN